MKTAFYFFLTIFGLVFLTGVGWGLRVLLLPARVIDRGISTVEGVVDKTLTADNAIYNYEWFKQQKADIGAIEQKITVAQDSVVSFELAAGARSTWTFEDKTEDARLRSITQGLQSQYRDMVGTYNARASMATRNIFEDGKIPRVLEMGASFLK